MSPMSQGQSAAQSQGMTPERRIHIFFLIGHAACLAGSQFLDWGLNSCPWQWSTAF